MDFWAPLKGLVYEGDVEPEADTEQAAVVLRARTGREAAAEDRTAARARVVRGAIVEAVERRGVSEYGWFVVETATTTATTKLQRLRSFLWAEL